MSFFTGFLRKWGEKKKKQVSSSYARKMAHVMQICNLGVLMREKWSALVPPKMKVPGTSNFYCTTGIVKIDSYCMTQSLQMICFSRPQLSVLKTLQPTPNLPDHLLVYDFHWLRDMNEDPRQCIHQYTVCMIELSTLLLRQTNRLLSKSVTMNKQRKH